MDVVNFRRELDFPRVDAVRLVV